MKVPVLDTERQGGKEVLVLEGYTTAPPAPGPISDDLRGSDGSPGQSIKGSNGWTPMFSGEKDGVRSLISVDWVGGEGTKPAAGYVGPKGSTGLVEKAQAYNFNPARSLVYMGATNASGDYVVTLQEPLPAPFICPVLYPSTAAERSTRITTIAKNAQGLVTGFTVRVEQRQSLTVLTLQVLSFGVQPVPGANVSVIVVDVS